ncbi:MAG: hypothetical protein A3G64_02435 [Candidatus Liptonbacteria bacterium RIFCSPLOWO2_12_FULL_60_15]|uniref:Uncharacterized protein n=2 Tax=Candidatus Liptoniibacteriota TaxID=1817909 RepID=A0A1G2CLN2_9BACT|nr:MAG: hypothetical protein A3E09_01245 [Candidatus Liptonbacteria bacterium RIFCSPHIGHO2_12_FULL_60_13]OGZ02314.1 MAG: hypothetical protein A3G64_02435 [Candidatus Liptonbacteria bacterium RIFCSPLOWO2_12_FULL_60_15]
MKNLIRYGTRVHAIALGAFALILTTGCAYSIGPGAGVKVVSNIPYHTMYHTMTVKVVNATNYTVTLLDDSGENSQIVAPGQTAVHRFWNLDSRSARFSLVATATDTSGKIVGSAEKRLSVSGTSKQSDSWILRKTSFR